MTMNSNIAVTRPPVIATRPNMNTDNKSETLTSVQKESHIVSKIAAANELADNAKVVKEVFKYKNTPVVYLPTRSMLRPPPTPGLLDYIRNAKTIEEVENLKKRIPKFKNASDSTLRKWDKAISKKLKELKVS